MLHKYKWARVAVPNLGTVIFITYQVIRLQGWFWQCCYIPFIHFRTSSSITLPGLMQSLSGFSSCLSSNSALARFRHCLLTALPSGDVSPLLAGSRDLQPMLVSLCRQSESLLSVSSSVLDFRFSRRWYRRADTLPQNVLNSSADLGT